jgi:hypothetical protein
MIEWLVLVIAGAYLMHDSDRMEDGLAGVV